MLDTGNRRPVIKVAPILIPSVEPQSVRVDPVSRLRQVRQELVALRDRARSQDSELTRKNVRDDARSVGDDNGTEKLRQVERMKQEVVRMRTLVRERNQKLLTSGRDGRMDEQIVRLRTAINNSIMVRGMK